MTPSFKHLFFIAISFLLPSLLDAQVLIKASADKDSILIGQPVVLTVEMRMPLGEKPLWKMPDSIPHFDWVNKGKVDTSEETDGKRLQQSLTVTSYDSGYWVVPSFTISVRGKQYKSDTFGIRVGYIPRSEMEDYRPVKPIEEVDFSKGIDKKWIVLSVITLLAMVAVFFLLRKKKPAEGAVAAVPLLAPYDEAIKALAQLKTSLPQEASELKPFYTSLNDVFRRYLSRSKQLPAAQKTTEELIQYLTTQGTSGQSLSKLFQTLRMADFVKFAKYQPSKEDHLENIQEIEKAVTLIHQQSSNAV